MRFQRSSFALVLLFFFPGIALPATRLGSDQSIVTIVYDVNQREFRCWYEGELIDKDPCSEEKRNHTFIEGTYFFRGQTIRLQLFGAVVNDLFAADLEVNELKIPSIPVEGGVSQLPSLKAIEEISRIILAPGVSLAAALPESEVADKLLYALDDTDKKDIQDFLKTSLFDILSNDKVVAALGWDSKRLIQKLDFLLGPGLPIVKTLENLKTELKTIGDELSMLRESYCPAPKEAGDPNDFSKLLIASKSLERVVDQQKALQHQINTSGISTLGKTISDQIGALQDLAVLKALRIRKDSLKDFVKDFETTFPAVKRRTLIGQIRVEGGKYTLPGQNEVFLGKINERNEHPATEESKKRLQENLLLLADESQDLEVAVAQLTAINELKTELDNYRDRKTATSKDTCSEKSEPSSPMSIFEFQESLTLNSLRTIATAESANCAARTMPLPADAALLTLGAWYDNKEITITLKRGTRLPLFDVSAVTTPSAKAAAGNPSQPQGSNPQTTPTDPASVRQTKLRVHNRAHFQLAFGFMRSDLPGREYKVIEQTVTEAGQSRKEQFFAQERNQSYHFLPTVDLLIYPWARDFFPWKPRYPDEKKPALYKNLAGLVGFALSAPHKHFFFGGAYMSSVGIGVKAGYHVGLVESLPRGAEPGSRLTGRFNTIEEKFEGGVFVGVNFHTKLFQDIFGVILKQ